ncbi:hypothetical protein G3570_11855 [Balneolaceae bacterium YR4-1]|uniref:GTP-binding protein n=1 Tax=Halalkalibaculum roseum TaxID=2709311 RepID=A0A6M1TB04_9BACT|nr:hypothetical protein [Halalkalibaculum roseum]NGP77333.1 hypothetical protein [Halalkalibaculum roseum]
MSQEQLEHIKFQRIRPRIRVESTLSPDQIYENISENLEKYNPKIQGTVLPGYATISPAEANQHYWSPQLTISIELKENGSLIRGLYGPKPHAWTMFVFFYSIIGFTTLIVSMIGLSYWSLGKDASILWFVPALTLLFLSLYLVAYLGQKFGQKQMIYLHHFMEKCLGERIEAK